MKEYKPSILFRNGHINTIFPTFFRKVKVKYERQRKFFENNDFLDFDWIKNGNSKIIILCHGLEGSSNSHYIKAFAKYFSENSWDVLAVNYRACNGVINPSPFYYVSGKGDEIEKALKLTEDYKDVILIGFSLGANKTLDFLGKTENIPQNVKGAFVVSPPCDLYGSTQMITKGFNKFYDKHFLRTLKKKVFLKQKKYPDIFKDTGISLKKTMAAKSLLEFDNEFTSKLNGCKDAIDYYTKNSSLYVLENIKIPTLILTALDDAMMSETCYPREIVKKNKFLKLETPKYGGHVSYASFNSEYWVEKYALEYIETEILKVFHKRV